MTGRTAFLVAAWAVAAGARADTTAAGLEFARLPLSVREQTAGAYGSYDVLKTSSNPALLAWQPREWEVGVGNQFLFAGEESLWGAAAGWAGKAGSAGSYAAGVVASGLSSQPLTVLDVFGNPTGSAVTSTALRVGAVAAYQWEALGVGLGVGHASESFSGIPGAAVTGPQATTIDVGGAVHLGSLDLGAAYQGRGGDAPAQLTAGAALKVEGPVHGAIGGDLALPLGGGAAKPFATAGVTWNALSLLDVRLGAQVPTGVAGAGGTSARLGLTAFWRDFALDYAFALPLGTGAGAASLIALNWRGGGVRVPYTPAPASSGGGGFALTAKERSIAVANFEPQAVSASDASVIADLLRGALVKEGTFNVVEKDNMDKVLNEQAFQQTGCTSQECAVKLGKVLNVKYLVVGTFGKSMGEFIVTMRVVEVETARIVYSDEGTGHNLDDIRVAINGLATRLTQAVKNAR